MKYTVFIKVIDFLKTPNELQKLPVNEKTCRPLNDVHIKDITILCQSICAVAVVDLQRHLANYLRKTPIVVYAVLIMSRDCISLLLVYNSNLLSW